MTALLLTLAILLVAIVNLWIIRRTKGMRKRQPYVAPTPLDAPITLGEAARYCEGDTILCRPTRSMMPPSSSSPPTARSVA